MSRSITLAIAFCSFAMFAAEAQTDDSAQQVPAAAVSLPLTAVGSNTAEPVQGGAELPYSEPLSPPSIATGIRAPLMAGGESSRSNFVGGNLQFSAGFDDNALASSSGNKVSDVSYMFAPGIMFAQTRARWSWDLAYNPGFTINQHFNQRNQSAHNLSTDLTFRLSPHVTFRLVDAFEKTNQLFSGVSSGPTNAETGSLQGPNESFITPLSQFTGNVTTADLGYQFRRSSIIGVGATYYLRNYDDVAGSANGSTSLVDTRSVLGNVYWGHQLSNKQWIGTAYNFQRITFQIGGDTLIHRLMVFYVVPLWSGSTLSLWAGPEYSSNAAIPSQISQGATSGSRWSPAGGITFDWQVRQTGFLADYSHRTTDGGGLTTAVEQQEIAVGVRRQLSARWAASAGVRYGNNDPLQQFVGSIGRTKVLSGSAGISRQMRNNLSFSAQYGRDHQAYSGTSSTSPADRNRVVVSLSYSFSRPLGR